MGKSINPIDMYNVVTDRLQSDNTGLSDGLNLTIRDNGGGTFYVDEFGIKCHLNFHGKDREL